VQCRVVTLNTVQCRVVTLNTKGDFTFKTFAETKLWCKYLFKSKSEAISKSRYLD